MGSPAYLQEFADRAAAVLGPHIHTSITLRHHGATVRAASSDAGAARCDQAEAMADDGPCVMAMTELSGQVIAHMATETRWRSWCDLAAEQGYRSVLAMPAHVAPDMALALNLYSELDDPWDEKLIAAADSYAQLAADFVNLRLQLAQVEDATAGIYSMLDADHVVEQAVGAIVWANDCTEEEARHILSSASSHRNVPERDVAEAILKALSSKDPTSWRSA